MAVFAPHLTSPLGGEIFNLGKVDITWDRNEPPTDDEYGATSVVSYELEYADNYRQDQTVWYTLRRRIPWPETSFTWIVGKSIKSDTVRLRIRAKSSLDQELSDWSMSGGDFSINVFKLIAPAIINPVSNHVFTDFILIILDETVTKNTFNQKVRYTLEYSSKKRDVDWTVIVKDIAVGQNVIRWDLEDITPADDYVLRLTAKNVSTSCADTPETIPDQIARRFVYDVIIQQPGMFFIDTQPPEAVLSIENSIGITSDLVQTLNVFAEDSVTDVKQIQIRECSGNDLVALGGPGDGATDTECLPIDLNDLTTLGKLLGHSVKTQWTFNDTSGTRKLEALLTDFGDNTSLQTTTKNFVTAFSSMVDINDLIIVQEQRDSVKIQKTGELTEILLETDQEFEVAYFVTSTGEYWTLEPFARQLAQLANSPDIKIVFEFIGIIYLFTYDINGDISKVFRDDKTAITDINTFPNALSQVNAVAKFQTTMFIGLENGELWSFTGSVFTLLNTFTGPVNAIAGDNQYLYIGLANSSLFILYNGTSFFTSDVEF